MSEFSYINLNTEGIKNNLKKGYEEIMGVTITTGDPIEDFIDWITYIFVIAAENMNFIGKMNLLKYSKDKFLDELGAFSNTERILEKQAECTVEYTFSKIFDEKKIIEKGHKIAKDNIIFESVENITLDIGKRKTYGKVRCLTSGILANDIEENTINTIIDDIPYLIAVTNITKTAGGANLEDDEAYRERIRLRPNSFSVAGPDGAYIYHTISAHQDIKDVYVYTPTSTPGVVKIIPLMKNGKIPEDEILEIIKKKLSDDVRPFTDKVEVEKPKKQSYNIELKYWINKTNSPNLIKTQIDNAVKVYIDWQKEKLGRDVNPNKLTQLLIEAGAKRVEITEPNYLKLERDSVAIEQVVNARYQGEEDE